MSSVAIIVIKAMSHFHVSITLQRYAGSFAADHVEEPQRWDLNDVPSWMPSQADQDTVLIYAISLKQ